MSMLKQIFVGRKEELKQLNSLLEKRSASLVVLRGRRRIGKSRLVEQFAQGHTFIRFSGIPPTKEVTAQEQREVFKQQLERSIACKTIKTNTGDWSYLFESLAKKTRTGRVIILFDEISWMGSVDPSFLGKLKNAWDREFNKNPKLILILCGSVSMWIEKNIVRSTGFFGRISHSLVLGELPLSDCQKFLEVQGFKGTVHESLKILSVTGGIPWYLEQIRPQWIADENIKNLCFRKNGILVEEYDLIFHDLFTKRSATYKKIIEGLARKPLELNDICELLSYQKSGVVSSYLEDLVQAGFVQRDYTWIPKTGKSSRLSHFRLSDNYLRFYLKYVDQHRGKIERDDFKETPLSTLPGWDSIMGFSFENLVLNNRTLLYQALNISPVDIVISNPFFQRKTTTQRGCQIDFLIQTRFNLLYVCEIKFSKRELKRSIIDEMKEKIARLSLPKGFACSPVLIHVNGVEEDVEDAAYFSHIVDFGRFLR